MARKEKHTQLCFCLSSNDGRQTSDRMFSSFSLALFDLKTPMKQTEAFSPHIPSKLEVVRRGILFSFVSGFLAWFDASFLFFFSKFSSRVFSSLIPDLRSLT